MTENQHRWYLMEWSKAWSRHWCGTRDGEVLPRPGRPRHSTIRAEIESIARGLAADGARVAPAHLLRYACHVQALGKMKSSWDLSNKDIDRVVAVFRLLAAEESLSAAMVLERAKSEPDRRAADPAHMPDADRKRMLWSLDNQVALDRPYIEKLCADKFGTSNYRSLDDRQLQQLLITAKSRAQTAIK